MPDRAERTFTPELREISLMQERSLSLISSPPDPQASYVGPQLTNIFSSFSIVVRVWESLRRMFSRAGTPLGAESGVMLQGISQTVAHPVRGLVDAGNTGPRACAGRKRAVPRQG